MIISGVPPYLLKTADNPEGVDASVFAGIEKAVAADRYAFFTEFFKNFYNTDLLPGEACERTSRAGQLERRRLAPPPPPAWRVSQPGTKTSARIWPVSMCPRW